MGPGARRGRDGLRLGIDDRVRCQLDLASELRRPIVLHCVRAHGALLDELRERAHAASHARDGSHARDANHARVRTLPPVVVMHAYGGSVETARQLLALGDAVGTAIYFGVSPRAAPGTRAAAALAIVPANRLLLESDEHDAQTASAALDQSRRHVCAARAWDDAQAAEQTAANARDAFSICLDAQANPR